MSYCFLKISRKVLCTFFPPHSTFPDVAEWCVETAGQFIFPAVGGGGKVKVWDRDTMCITELILIIGICFFFFYCNKSKLYCDIIFKLMLVGLKIRRSDFWVSLLLVIVRIQCTIEFQWQYIWNWFLWQYICHWLNLNIPHVWCFETKE